LDVHAKLIAKFKAEEEVIN
jgi:hypothetical protein